jgi:hypothetical protein
MPAVSFSLMVSAPSSSQRSKKATGHSRIAASRWRTLASEASGSRPMWPKTICFQPRCRP